MTVFRSALACLAAFAVVFHATAVRADAGDNIIRLGMLGGDDIDAVAINDSGQIVGTAYPPISVEPRRRAYLYQAGVMTNLGALGGKESSAVDINAAGQVIGTWVTEAGQTRPFLYSSGTMTDLGSLGGADAYPVAINGSGQVAGVSLVAPGQSHAFLYANDAMTDLGTLGGLESFATDMNDAGVIVGQADTATARHAFRYEGGTMEDLGTLGGSESLALAINASGDIVGVSRIAGDGALHAFLFDAASETMIDLGTLGGANSAATHINAAGQIAGHSEIAGEDAPHAFLYFDGTMHDLGSVATAASFVNALSDAGDVLLVEYPGLYANGTGWHVRNGIRRRVSAEVSVEPLAINSSGIIAGNVGAFQWLTEEITEAFVTACPLAPAADCSAGPRSAIDLRSSADPDQNRLRWSWSRGDAIGQDDLGSPDTSTSYSLCVYDSEAGESNLATALHVPRSTGWRDRSPKGWQYVDGKRTIDGVGRIQVRTGADGAAKIKLQAKGGGIPMPLPVSEEATFAGDPSVTVQLRNSSTPACWSSEFTTPDANDEAGYSASIRE